MDHIWDPSEGSEYEDDHRWDLRLHLVSYQSNVVQNAQEVERRAMQPGRG